MRLGLALLNHLADRNEALAGDLLEGYQLTQSRVWFWKQLLGAIMSGAFRSTGFVRPLKLVDSPTWLPPRENYSANRAQLMLLLGGSGVHGIGGLGMIAVVLLVTSVDPVLWGLLAFGILSGVAIGAIRVVIARRRGQTALAHHLLIR